MGRKISSGDRAYWQRACNAEAKLCSAKTLSNAWHFISGVIYEETGERPDIRLPQIVPNDRPFLNPDQIDIFIDAVAGKDVEIPALLALSSLRRSEILALQWGNVDLDAGIIHISGVSVFDEHRKLVAKKENKNQTSNRIVPIMMDQLSNALRSAPHGSESVVTMKPDSIPKRINKICEENGLPKVSVHGLRHSFASLAYHLNIPEKIAMEIGGWANDQTMHKIYTHTAQMDVEHYKNAMMEYYKSHEKRKNANGSANGNEKP